jgi:hypothetical protein
MWEGSKISGPIVPHPEVGFSRCGLDNSSLVAQRLPIPRPPPEALHILDRFHIVAKMNTALDEVRAGESRRMANEGRTPH